MTLFLWFAFVSALVGYVAVSPMEPGQEASPPGREPGPPRQELAPGPAPGVAPDQAPPAGLSPGRAMWLGFLAGLGADLIWALLTTGWVLATGTRPAGPAGMALLLGVTGLVAFGAVWWLMLKRVYRIEGPQLRRLAVVLLLSYPVVLGLGIFLAG